MNVALTVSVQASHMRCELARVNYLSLMDMMMMLMVRMMMLKMG